MVGSETFAKESLEMSGRANIPCRIIFQNFFVEIVISTKYYNTSIVICWKLAGIFSVIPKWLRYFVEKFLRVVDRMQKG